MVLQIFGTKKCKDTQKAQRFFKERGISFQFINLMEKEMSPGEFNSVLQSVGSFEELVNWDHKDQDAIADIRYREKDQAREYLRINGDLMNTPILRHNKKVVVGRDETIWREWAKELK